MKRARWEVEGEPRVEVQRAGDDDGECGDECAEPQADGDLTDGGDAPVEQQDVDDADARGDERRLPHSHAAPDVARVACETDVARSDLQWPTQDELPDEKERHQPP